MTQRKRARARARIAALGLMLLYLLLALLFLDRVPTVHEDEPWIASTSWSLATRGVFGSRMFDEMDQMSERYYEFMPLYPLAQAFLFRGAGVGLFQARFVSVAAGALTLSLTFALGRKLFNPTVGFFAIGLLLMARTASGTGSLPTGILFLDVNRLARYDALVPVFGLSALLVFLAARAREKKSLYFLAGALAGLAALAHLYGVFWSGALLLLAWRGDQKIMRLRALVLGMTLPWLVYMLYVLTGLDAWRAQQHWNASRFAFWDGAWYVQNVLNEPTRYAFQELATMPWAHVSALLVFSGWLATCAIFIWRAWRLRDDAALVLIIVTACFVGGFAVLVNNKVPNYLVTLAPLIALSCGWSMSQLWALGKRERYRFLRALLVLMVGLILWNSVPPVAIVYANAAAATPYTQIVNALRNGIEPRARVLGLHSTWFGYTDMEYRNIIAVFDRATQLGAENNSLSVALSEFDPQVIVLDPRLRAYFDQAETDGRPAQVKAWMRAQRFECVWSANDPTHGTFEIYRRASDTLRARWDGTCSIH